MYLERNHKPAQKSERASHKVRKRVKRYNLALPEDLFNEIQEIANDRGTTVLEILRKFIKLGLIVVEMEKEPGSALVMHTEESEQEIILI